MGTNTVSRYSPSEELRKGKLHLKLSGKKLKGEWTLVRIRHPREGADKEQWLLLKTGSGIAPISSRAEDQSVLTKRTLKQIAGNNNAQWQSIRASTRRFTATSAVTSAR